MAMSDMTMHLLHEVERLRPLIKDNAASAEANRQWIGILKHFSLRATDRELPQRASGGSWVPGSRRG